MIGNVKCTLENNVTNIKFFINKCISSTTFWYPSLTKIFGIPNIFFLIFNNKDKVIIKFIKTTWDYHVLFKNACVSQMQIDMYHFISIELEKVPQLNFEKNYVPST